MEIRERLDSTERSNKAEENQMNSSINIMRLFIKSDRTKTLRGQQFRKPQDIKKEAAVYINYIIYSVESCFESRLDHLLHDAAIVSRLGITASLHIFHNPSFMLPLASA